jgi:hypothetical protein
LAHAIKAAVEGGQKEIPITPEEHVYEVNLEIQRTLGMIEPLGTHSPTVSQELG